MRKYTERPLDSGIYARLQEVRINSVDRQNAIAALRQAELLANAYLWVTEKLAGVGHIFLKPSLKH
ncbi:MAG TPA: hypothetical protein VFR39_05550 [Burkholderiales bacterium]|nr:hypothetical protein [Burkholderiales bacterium]